MRRACVISAVAAAAGLLASGCAPPTLDPHGMLRKRTPGAAAMPGYEHVFRMPMRGMKIISGRKLDLGRPRRGRDFFDPEKAGRDVGSLAEWALKREGKDADTATPGSVPSIPAFKKAPPIEYPTLEEMKPLIPVYLVNPDARLRIAAAIAAAHYGDRSAVPELCAMVTRCDAAAAAAARALGAIGDPRAAKVLERVVRSGGPLAREATDALGELRHPAATGGLLRALRSSDYRLRLSAARGLGRLGGPKARAAMLRVANDAEELLDVRIAAAAGLARMGAGKLAIDLLLAGSASPVPERAAAALAGLARIDDGRATEALAGGLALNRGQLWVTCLWGLMSSSSKRSRAYLERLASDRRLRVRERARLGLVLAGAPGADAMLAGLTRSRDPVIRAEAATALGFGGKETELAPLETLLRSDPDAGVRRAAAAAVGRLGRAEGVEILSRELGSDDAVLRAVAMAGIAYIRGGRPEDVAEKSVYTEVELAEQAARLGDYTVERVIASGRSRAAMLVSPGGRRMLVGPGDKVFAGFTVKMIVARGEETAPGERAWRAIVVLEKGDARVVLVESP